MCKKFRHGRMRERPLSPRAGRSTTSFKRHSGCLGAAERRSRVPAVAVSAGAGSVKNTDTGRTSEAAAGRVLGAARGELLLPWQRADRIWQRRRDER
jgi:hypothetical protein